MLTPREAHDLLIQVASAIEKAGTPKKSSIFRAVAAIGSGLSNPRLTRVAVSDEVDVSLWDLDAGQKVQEGYSKAKGLDDPEELENSLHSLEKDVEAFVEELQKDEKGNLQPWHKPKSKPGGGDDDDVYTSAPPIHRK